MSRGRAKFRESDVWRIFKAARRAGVHVRLEIRDDEIVATTIGDEEAKAAATTADDELARWRKRHAG